MCEADKTPFLKQLSQSAVEIVIDRDKVTGDLR